ncbi:ProQ/FinO family protein [Paraburkholderia sp.]|uniref:ProQ/FinO family protein n=1 Tax=Paraburkholderia sp. TaxID=1926495 RepID=UPI003D6E7D24
MGFEQLAALKAQLKKQAEQQRAQQAPKKSRPARPARPASASPAAPGAAKGATNGAADAAARNAPANAAASAAAHAAKAKPVDPVVQTFARLQKRFPLAFPKNPAPKVPLKVGVFEDLLTHAKVLGVDEAGLRDALRTWCRGSRYWACMVEGAKRVDLEGNEAGEVTRSDAVRALALKKGRSAKPAAKKAEVAAPVAATEVAAVEVVATETTATADAAGEVPTATSIAHSEVDAPADTAGSQRDA